MLRFRINPHSKILSLAKAISWRVIGTLDTIFISFFITSDVAVAGAIGIVEVISKTLLYFIHERAWLRVNAKNPLKFSTPFLQ